MNYRNRDIRVRRNELVIWNPKTRTFDTILKDLPYSFGDYSVSNVAITSPSTKVLRVLLFRKTNRFFDDGYTHVYPVVCFYSPFRYEIPCCEHSFRYMVGGEENFRKVMRLSRINWNIAKIHYRGDEDEG